MAPFSEIDVAYCAGLFDGEGCLSVSPYPLENGRQRFHCDVYVGMQNFSTLEFFKDVVGAGNITHRKDCWMYHVAGVKSVQVIKMLLPHLRAKREAAAMYVEFAATFNPHVRPTPTDVVEKRMLLSQRIRAVMKADALSFRSNELLTSTDLGVVNLEEN